MVLYLVNHRRFWINPDIVFQNYADKEVSFVSQWLLVVLYNPVIGLLQSKASAVAYKSFTLTSLTLISHNYLWMQNYLWTVFVLIVCMSSQFQKAFFNVKKNHGNHYNCYGCYGVIILFASILRYNRSSYLEILMLITLLALLWKQTLVLFYFFRVQHLLEMSEWNR